MDSESCLNCESVINKKDKYCANCGQESHVHRFTLAHFFHEVFHAFTHTDKGIFYLLKELAIRPGIVAKEYISGKRKKYFNPFTFFLILAAFFVLSSTFSSEKEIDIKKNQVEEISGIKDPSKRQVAIAMFDRGIKTRQFFTKHGNIVAMIAVPFFAFYFWLIFYRRSYNYPEHLVANLMFVSFANLAFSLLVYPLQALLKDTSYAFLVLNLGFLLQLVYFVVAYRGLMELNGFWPMFKIILATLIVLVLWIAVTLMASAIYVYQNWHFMDYFKHMGGR